MSVRLIDLKGQKFNLEFEGDITVQAIRQKLLKDYNYDTNRCYFCKAGRILSNEKISKEKTSQKESDAPIVIFNSQVFPDKSYPKVDNAFQLNFSRYGDSFYGPKGKSTVQLEMTDEDLSHLISSPNQLERLISLGILPANVLFSRILNDVRSRNEMQDANDHSDSDNEETEPVPELSPYQQINIEPYEGDEIIADDDELEPYPEELGPIIPDYQPIFIPQNNVDRDFGEPLNDFVFHFNDHEPFFHLDMENEIVEQNEDRPAEHPQNEEQNPEPQDGQARDRENEQLLQENQQRLLDQQRNLEQQNNEAQQPANNGNTIRRIRNPFAFDFERRQDDLNQQIIEGLNLNITLSDVDNRAISRLAQAGYDRAMVIQIYEACDRNEEAAMNLLVSMG